MPFSGPKWPNSPEQKNFGTNDHYYFHLPISSTIIITFIYQLVTFIVQNLKKKFFQWILSYEDAQFWAQNGPFPQMIIFSEKLLMSFVSSIHVYLHAKIKVRYKSMSEVLKIK